MPSMRCTCPSSAAPLLSCPWTWTLVAWTQTCTRQSSRCVGCTGRAPNIAYLWPGSIPSPRRHYCFRRRRAECGCLEHEYVADILQPAATQGQLWLIDRTQTVCLSTELSISSSTLSAAPSHDGASIRSRSRGSRTTISVEGRRHRRRTPWRGRCKPGGRVAQTTAAASSRPRRQSTIEARRLSCNRNCHCFAIRTNGRVKAQPHCQGQFVFLRLSASHCPRARRATTAKARTRTEAQQAALLFSKPWQAIARSPIRLLCWERPVGYRRYPSLPASDASGKWWKDGYTKVCVPRWWGWTRVDLHATGLTEMLRGGLFVGIVDTEFALVQYETKLLLVNLRITWSARAYIFF